MGEDRSRVHQEDPSVLERQPDQKRKTRPPNFKAKKEKDLGSLLGTTY